MACFVCFLSGANAEESLRNFYNWLYEVFDELRLPPGCIIKSRRGRRIVNGCFHHMMGAEALGLVGGVQARLATWGAACISARLSCGSVLISANDGRGQSSLEQQLVGPFLD